MATVSTIGSRSRKSPSFSEQRAERLAAVTATMANDVDRDNAEREARQAKRHRKPLPQSVVMERFAPALAPLREMTKADICNVEPLTASEEAKVFDRIGTLPSRTITNKDGVTFTLYDWADSDERWGMTPHQLRRYEESLV